MDVVVLEAVIAWLATLLVICALAFRFLVWNLYVGVRNERDALTVRLAELQDRFERVSRGRDEWHSVADRALMMADSGVAVGARAARVARKVVTGEDLAEVA